MKKLFILTIMMMALSSQAKALDNPCEPLGAGLFRCDLGEVFCIKSSYEGLQCFEKK